MDDLVEAMVCQRRSLPDKSSDLSIVDSALIPLLELHRALFVAQPIEDQIEPSEMDLLTFGITEADLRMTAEELGCQHLGPPTGPQPEEGRVVGIKERIIVVRTIKIRRKTLSVTFILDTGAPVSFVCDDTLRAFGIDMQTQPGNYVHGEVEGGVGLDLYFLDPRGDKGDLNILGMDYMLRVDASLKFVGRSRHVFLKTN
jgi:hypothetical protein